MDTERKKHVKRLRKVHQRIIKRTSRKKNPVLIVSLTISIVFIFIALITWRITNNVNLNEVEQRSIAFRKIKILLLNNENRAGLVYRISKKFKLPPLLITSIIYAESSNHKYAISHAGALGLMQIMPAVAIERAALNKHYFVSHLIKIYPKILFNEILNIYFGCEEIAWLRKHVRGWDSILHAYNGGINAFRRGFRNRPYANKILFNWKYWKRLSLKQMKIYKSKITYGKFRE